MFICICRDGKNGSKVLWWLMEDHATKKQGYMKPSGKNHKAYFEETEKPEEVGSF